MGYQPAQPPLRATPSFPEKVMSYLDCGEGVSQVIVELGNFSRLVSTRAENFVQGFPQPESAQANLKLPPHK